MKDNNLLKEVCGEMAEIALAARYGVSQEELFDEDGSFYPQYQDTFNTLYDYAEEQMTLLFTDVNSFRKTSTIYTTGAFLCPVMIMDESGATIWIWAVSQFDDDAYLDGEICRPVVSAETIEKLLLTDDEDSTEIICCAGYPDCFCNE